MTYIFLLSEFGEKEMDAPTARALLGFISDSGIGDVTRTSQYVAAACLHYIASKYQFVSAELQEQLLISLLHTMMQATPINNILSGTYRPSELIPRILMAVRAEASLSGGYFVFGIERFISILVRTMQTYTLTDLTCSENLQARIGIDHLLATYALPSALSTWRSFFSSDWRGTRLEATDIPTI